MGRILFNFSNWDCSFITGKLHLKSYPPPSSNLERKMEGGAKLKLLKGKARHAKHGLLTPQYFLNIYPNT